MFMRFGVTFTCGFHRSILFLSGAKVRNILKTAKSHRSPLVAAVSKAGRLPFYKAENWFLPAEIR
jgi:hypothetical protein